MICKTTSPKSNKTIFVKWSRKSWAIFNSLKLVVHSKLNRITSFKHTILKDKNGLIEYVFNNSIRSSKEACDVYLFYIAQYILMLLFSVIHISLSTSFTNFFFLKQIGKVLTSQCNRFHDKRPCIGGFYFVE